MEDELDVRIVPEEGGNEVRKDLVAPVHGDPDGEAALLAVLQILQKPVCLLIFKQDLFDIFQVLFAQVCGTQGIDAALKDRSTDLFLQLQELLAQRGLRDVELCGSFGDAAFFGDSLNVFQLAEIHGGLHIRYY